MLRLPMALLTLLERNQKPRAGVHGESTRRDDLPPP